MEVGVAEIVMALISAFSSGALTHIFLLKANKQKASAEAGQIIAEYYRNEINYLTAEISKLRDRLLKVEIDFSDCAKKLRMTINENKDDNA